MPLSGEGQIPFRRMTDPVLMAVSPTASQFVVPDGYIPDGANSFWIVNPNNFWVRLKGSGLNKFGQPIDATYIPVIGTDGQGTGWCWSPGFQGVFTSQFPKNMSVISITKQGLTAGSGFIEMAWGMGSW